MPLYDTEYTHALIMAMVCSLAAFLLCWLWNLASATYAYDGIGNLATSIWNRARQPIPPMNTCGLWSGMAQGGYQVLWIQGKQCVWYRLWPYQQ